MTDTQFREVAEKWEHEIGEVTVMVGVYQGGKVLNIILAAMREAYGWGLNENEAYKRGQRDCAREIQNFLREQWWGVENIEEHKTRAEDTPA